MPEAFKYVKLPDGKYAKFRADASPEQMKMQVQKDFPQAFTPDRGATHQGTISATPPIGLTHPINWLQSAENDIRSGGDTTWLGRGYKAAGGQPLESGTSEAAANFVGGPAVGPIKAVRGGLRLARGPVSEDATTNLHEGMRGVNELVGGAAQTAGPFLGAMQPEFLPRAAAYSGVNKGLQKGAEYLGADPETSEFIGNVGTMAAPFMEKVPFKAAAAKVGNAAANIVDPDVVGLVSPRAAHAQRLAGKIGKIAAKPGATPEPSIPETATPEQFASRIGSTIPNPGEGIDSPWGGSTKAAGTISRTRPGLSDTPNVISNEEANARFQGKQEAYEPPAAKPIRATKPPDEAVERVTGAGATLPRAEDLGAFPEEVNEPSAGYVNPEPSYRGLGPEPQESAPAPGPPIKIARQASPMPFVPSDYLQGEGAAVPGHSGYTAPEPRWAYRSRDVGETGVPNESHSQATLNPEQAEGYLTSRGEYTGKPQEMIRTDLNRLQPHEYEIQSTSAQPDFVKFRRPLTEEEIEKYGNK